MPRSLTKRCLTRSYFGAPVTSAGLLRLNKLDAGSMIRIIASALAVCGQNLARRLYTKFITLKKTLIFLPKKHLLFGLLSNLKY